MKIVCAGLPKTGTKSCSSALRILGYNVADYIETVEFLRNFIVTSIFIILPGIILIELIMLGNKKFMLNLDSSQLIFFYFENSNCLRYLVVYSDSWVTLSRSASGPQLKLKVDKFNYYYSGHKNHLFYHDVPKPALFKEIVTEKSSLMETCYAQQTYNKFNG